MNRSRTNITVDEKIKMKALTIAKKKGINKFSTLVNVLLAEYVQNNKELLPEHLKKDL